MSAVTATFNYFVPPADGSRPITYVTPAAAQAANSPPRNWSSAEHQLAVNDLRGREDTVSLDRTGFQYLKHETSLKDFTDNKTIEEVYYPESVALLKQATGASRVVIFDHTIRKRRPGADGMDPAARQPAAIVHVDQTPKAAENRVRRHLPAEDVPSLLNKRYQIVNLWRPITHPADDTPLAVCDFRSIDYKNDLVPGTLQYEGYAGETFAVKFSEKHQWYYLKGMRTDEVVLIKCADSIQDGSVAALTPHSAFVDPTTPADAPLRESIELRALVFYD